jgi:hypothetical protein
MLKTETRSSSSSPPLVVPYSPHRLFLSLRRRRTMTVTMVDCYLRSSRSTHCNKTLRRLTIMIEIRRFTAATTKQPMA